MYNKKQEGDLLYTSIIDSTYVDLSKPTTYINYFRIGNIVHLRFSFTMKSNCNEPYAKYTITEKLPARAYCCTRSCNLCVDDCSDTPVFVEVINHNLTVFSRHMSIAGKVIVGGLTYISNGNAYGEY